MESYPSSQIGRECRFPLNDCTLKSNKKEFWPFKFVIKTQDFAISQDIYVHSRC
jgi:hypothetical protein